ncbi:MAG TPA: magnesium transporter CorA family protein [Acetobacteraceae bacterium]|nr:magnesium transporter CorA family protein [Acetobacteraceae bacterium]
MLTAFTCDDGRPRRHAGDLDDSVLHVAIWIDLLSPTTEEIARVEAATRLHIPTEAEISEIESSSRLSTHDGTLYLSLPLLHLEQTARTVSAGFVLNPDRLLTVRFVSGRIFDTFGEHLPRGDTRADGPAAIMIGLMEAIVDHQADGLEQVRAEMDAVSHSVFAMGVADTGGRKQEDRMLRRTLGQLGRMSDLISHIRETQVNAGRIVPYVSTNAKEWLSEDLQARLDTLRRDIQSINDFDTHLNDKLQFLLDATLGFINIAQNNVMKVLTIASVVGIPPVLIAGVYGMNFKSMPEYDWAWGYAWGLGLIIITGLIPLLAFRWRNWI